MFQDIEKLLFGRMDELAMKDEGNSKRIAMIESQHLKSQGPYQGGNNSFGQRDNLQIGNNYNNNSYNNMNSQYRQGMYNQNPQGRNNFNYQGPVNKEMVQNPGP